jgi:hypothetical protein
MIAMWANLEKPPLYLTASIDARTRFTRAESSPNGSVPGMIIWQEQICCQDFGNAFCITEIE